MTEKHFREIWKKTNGHCHFCGDPISLRKRGYRRQRADGCWEVDHVTQRAKGGAPSIENCLPACTSCNRLRWHRKGAELREMLLLGMIAKREMDRFTETGNRLIALHHQQSRQNKRRRTGAPLRGAKTFDPVLQATIRKKERDTLVCFLKTYPKQAFSPRQLSKRTGVPKSRIRRVLETARKVAVLHHGTRYEFQIRSPKRNRSRTQSGTLGEKVRGLPSEFTR